MSGRVEFDSHLSADKLVKKVEYLEKNAKVYRGT